MKAVWDHCRICSDLIEAAEKILEERTAGDTGSREEWFYCPHCRFTMVSLNERMLQLRQDWPRPKPSFPA